jgi:hypothetical protein
MADQGVVETPPVCDEWAAQFFRQHYLAFTDVADALRGGLTAPPQLVENLIIEAQVNWLSGHPGHGKTTVAMWIAKLHMENDGHVIWLDWEGGATPTLLRAREVGVADDLLGSHFHLANDPEMSPDAAGLGKLERALREWPKALVVFDSASKALSLAGLGENAPEEVTRWTTQIVMPVRKHGATALVIDHVVKGATASMPYPRGSGSKLADTEVAWYVEKAEDFNREKSGELKLTRHKDRSGILPEEVRLRIGDGMGGLPIELIDSGSRSRGNLGIVKERVVKVLKAEAPKPLTTTQLRKMVTGNNTKIADAAKELAADLTEPVSVESGSGDKVLFSYDENAVASPLARSVL